MYKCICTILCYDVLISNNCIMNNIKQYVKNQNIKLLKVEIITKDLLFRYCLNTESYDPQTWRQLCQSVSHLVQDAPVVRKYESWFLSVLIMWL